MSRFSWVVNYSSQECIYREMIGSPKCTAPRKYKGLCKKHLKEMNEAVRAGITTWNIIYAVGKALHPKQDKMKPIR